MSLLCGARTAFSSKVSLSLRCEFEICQCLRYAQQYQQSAVHTVYIIVRVTTVYCTADIYGERDRCPPLAPVSSISFVLRVSEFRSSSK